MPSLIVLFKDRMRLNEIQKVLRFVNGWDFLYTDWIEQKEDIFRNLREQDVHYLLCISEPDPILEDVIQTIRSTTFILGQIYYDGDARNVDLNRLNALGFTSIIIGEERHKQLSAALHNIDQNYWRRIPDNFEGISRQTLPPRAERILRYMESAPIPKISIEELSRFMRISPSHLRKIFNEYFQMNFREFKQALLARYEMILLFEQNLKPGQIYEILDYKNLSAFSRSFKSRHGVTWQNYKRN